MCMTILIDFFTFDECLDWHMVKKVTLLKITNWKNHVFFMPNVRVNVDIPFNQCVHFNQVEHFEKSWFIKMLTHEIFQQWRKVPK